MHFELTDDQRQIQALTREFADAEMDVDDEEDYERLLSGAKA